MRGVICLLKNYKFVFDIAGLVLFLLIMIPNFIWAAIPAPNDILRSESVTPLIDKIGSVFQILLVGVLCAVIRKERTPLHIFAYLTASIICVFLYYAGWILYYLGFTNAMIILLLTIPPCLAFLFFAADRKNRIAVCLSIGFMICHLIYGVVNYIL